MKNLISLVWSIQCMVLFESGGASNHRNLFWVHKPSVRQGCWQEKLHISAADCSPEHLNCSCRKELQAIPSDQLEWVSLVMEYTTDLRGPVIEWGSQVSFSASYYSHDTSQNIVYNVLHMWEYPSLLFGAETYWYPPSRACELCLKAQLLAPAHTPSLCPHCPAG